MKLTDRQWRLIGLALCAGYGWLLALAFTG